VLAPLKDAVTRLKNSVDVGGIQTRLGAVLKTATNGLVIEAITNKKFDEKITNNYRGKVYKDSTRTYPIMDFLAFVLGNNSSSTEQAVRSFVAVMEILLRDALNTPIDWNAEIEKAKDAPIKLKPLSSLPSLPAAENRVAFNTRLCFDPSMFRTIAHLISILDQKTDSGRNAIKANIQSHLDFLRPMNIFNPTQALGTTANTAPPGARENNQNINTMREDFNITSEQEGLNAKRLVDQLKFATQMYPKGRNSSSALTTSALFQSHLGSHDSAQREGKRGAPEDLYKDASFHAAKRNKLVGGVLVGQNFDYIDSLASKNRLLSAIPGARELEGYEDMDTNTEEPSIPMNIALDAAYRIFTLDGTHQDFGGSAQSNKMYRVKLVERFHEFAQETEPRTRIFSQGWATQKITRQAFEAIWDSDCIPLVSFELWRPRQRYFMGSGFMAEGGSNLGNAFHGFHDFQWADDPIRKVHVGHYTFNVCCPVKDAKMFAMVEDMVAMGYRSGEDVSFIQSPEEFNTLCTDPDHAPGSIIVKMVPYNRGMPSSPQDLGSRWNVTIVSQVSGDGPSGDNPIHGQSAYYYNHLYGLDRINSSLVIRNDANFVNPTSVINTVCWLAHHRLYDPTTGKWEYIILDDGPFGSNVYKGCVSDRDVIGKPLKDMEFAKTCQIFS